MKIKKILWSNNLIRQNIWPPTCITSNVIVRINLAWHNNLAKLKKEIKALEYPIMLDYPHNRVKPAEKGISFLNAAKLTKLKNVEYFAYSNAEWPKQMENLRKMLPEIKIVPKIETRVGVKNIIKIVRSAKTDMVMLDTEDLYHDAKEEYLHWLKIFDYKTKNLKVFRLQGVVFTT